MTIFKYGLDAPYVTYKLLSLGFLIFWMSLGMYFSNLIFVLTIFTALCYSFYEKYYLSALLLAFLLIGYNFQYIKIFAIFLSLFISMSFLAPAILMLLSSLIGKRLQANQIIDKLTIKGNEKILDIGCGRGLLTIKAAKKINKGGKIFGIDIFSADDLSMNSYNETINLIKKENIENKVSIIKADARNLPFEDDFFDIIVSSMVFHNMDNKNDREKALKESIRVLKPNGIIVIQDFKYINEYAEFFKSINLKNVSISNLKWLIFPPVRVTIASK